MKRDLHAIHLEIGAKLKDPKEWARRLKRREEQLEPLTYAQRIMWRAALGRGAPESKP